MTAPLPKTPLPMTVISGYLGAGKTTLVNHLLRNAGGRRLFVLVNDFGEIAIDAELIEARDGESLTLANGCVCCSLGGDLYRALSRVLDHEPRPGHLVIEASGVAEPARIAAVARAEPELEARGIIALCDAETLEARLAEPLLMRALSEQIAAADLLLLNKCDRVAEDRLAALQDLLRALNEDAAILTVQFAEAPIEQLLDRRDDKKQLPASSEIAHDGLYESWAWQSDQVPSLESLEETLAGLPGGLLRVKGLLVSADGGTAWEIQGTVGVATVKRRSVPMNAQPGLRLVAIGLKGRFDRASLERRFRETIEGSALIGEGVQ